MDSKEIDNDLQYIKTFRDSNGKGLLYRLRDRGTLHSFQNVYFKYNGKKMSICCPRVFTQNLNSFLKQLEELKEEKELEENNNSDNATGS
jgi:hypothetical protein